MNDFIYLSYFVKKIIRNFINVKKEELVAKMVQLFLVSKQEHLLSTLGTFQD